MAKDITLEFHQWYSEQYITDHAMVNMELETCYDIARKGLLVRLKALIAQKEVAQIEVKYPDGWVQYVKMRLGLRYRFKFFPINIVDLYPGVDLPGHDRRRVYLERLTEGDDE